MNKPVEVSLVIPLYNQVDYTKQCVASIERCTKIPYELILVDNCSTDGTRGFLKDVKATVIVNATNLGCAKAWNQGVRAATGQVIGILNNDIIVTPGWLEGLLSYMQHCDHGVVCPSAREGRLNYDLDAYAKDFTSRCATATRSELYGACMVIRREVFDRIGLFDEGFCYGGCEDIDFLWRTEQAGFTAGMTGSVLIHHFSMVTRDTIKRTETAAYIDQNAAYFARKWKRTVRGNWLQRRWGNVKVKWRARYERFRYGHTLVEKWKG
ncbi:MAG: glycosyltransferase family 2 protein [Nitrospira sp.]|nr:glycosyltransferase family 2 protein [Nitrospira sp.]